LIAMSSGFGGSVLTGISSRRISNDLSAMVFSRTSWSELSVHGLRQEQSCTGH
jgi:hypothetical protein